MIQASSEGQDTASALRERANDCAARGEWEPALAAYRQAGALDLQDARPLVGMGFVLQELGRDEEASQALRRAIELRPESALDAHYLLGRIARRQGRAREAIDHFECAIALDASFAPAHQDLVALMLSDETVDAIAAAERAVAAVPGMAQLQFYLGIARTRARDLSGAIAAYERAIALEPSAPVAHLNLARLYMAREQPERAVQHFESAVRLAPGNVEARIGAIGALNKLRRFDKALADSKAALEVDPANPRLYALRGSALASLQYYESSLAAYARALELAPEDPEIFLGMANTLLAMGRRDDAIENLRKSLALRPHSGIAHMLASLTGEGAERAPDDYVATLFDQYAEDFDAHLVGVLKYDVPAQLARAMSTAWASEPRKQYRILDLGCGTGLMGVELAPFVKNLTGVDLSTKMLDKARARNLYTRLEQADLEVMMRGEQDASYDAIVAADVFVYVGKLDALAEQAYRLLAPGGLFAFSVESADALEGDSRVTTYRLESTGRYIHAKDYLGDLARNCGFEEVALLDTYGRENYGKPVAAYLCVLRRPDAP
ncbi:MAG: tetratricopeptide repeat protein [Burkholderiales bacterium]